MSFHVSARFSCRRSPHQPRANSGRRARSAIAFRHRIGRRPGDTQRDARKRLGRTAAMAPTQRRNIAVLSRSNPATPPRITIWAKGYRYLGEINEAAAEYRRAMKLDPSMASPHLGLGNLFSGQNKPDEAITANTAAPSSSTRTTPPPTTISGNALGDQAGKPDEAIAEYRRAIQLDPEQRRRPQQSSATR